MTISGYREQISINGREFISREGVEKKLNKIKSKINNLNFDDVIKNEIITPEIIDKKLNKLRVIIDNLLNFDDVNNLTIAKVHTKIVLKRLHTPIYFNSIFKGSFCNPFRHAQLTFMVGKLASKFSHVEDASIKLKSMLAQITIAYEAMLKIQKIPQTCLPSSFDIQWSIIQLMLTEKDGDIKFDQISKIRDIYYGFMQEDIWQTIQYDVKNDFPRLNDVEAEKEKVNLENFGKAMVKVIASFKIKEFSNFTVRDFTALGPHITHYNHKMFTGVSFDECAILKNFPNLTSVNLRAPESLEGLPFPEKILELKIKIPCSIISRSTPEETLKKCINIKFLKIINNDDMFNLLLNSLTFPEKLKSLSYYSRINDVDDAFLGRLENIETLKLSGSLKKYNLSLLPYPRTIKHLHVTECSLKKELFSKFVNLESFSLPIDSDSTKESMSFLTMASKLKALTFSYFHERKLKDCPVFPNVKTIKLLDHKYVLFSDSLQLSLLFNKFPELKNIQVKNHIDNKFSNELELKCVKITRF